MPFSKNSEDLFALGINIRNNYQLFQLTSAVRKVGLTELLTNIERRENTFIKARLAQEFALKERESLKKPYCMVIYKYTTHSMYKNDGDGVRCAMCALLEFSCLV